MRRRVVGSRSAPEWLRLLAVVALAGAGAAVGATGVLGAIGLARPVLITSGSMRPTIDAGDVVILRPTSTARPGDIVTFARGDDLVTHRVVQREGSGLLRTRGDDNPTADDALVAPSDVVGRAVAVVPAVGRPMLWRSEGRWARVTTVALVGAAVLVIAFAPASRRCAPGAPVELRASARRT